jgi:hypothetical protein
MRDIALVLFVGALMVLAVKRPFLFVLAYMYVDTVSPQRISYFLLNRVPISLIVAALAIGGWLIADQKDFPSPRQMIWFCRLHHLDDRGAVSRSRPGSNGLGWKASLRLLPAFTLRTRLDSGRPALLTLSAAAIIITGGIKTIPSGGGYGVLGDGRQQ